MRFTAEQRAKLQSKMIDAHEAKQAAWLEQKINTRLADLERAQLACEAMVTAWTGKVSPELLQLVVTPEWIVDYEYGDALMDICLDESLPTPLVLEYEGEVLEIIKSNVHDCFNLQRLPSESRIGAPETPAAAEQDVWEYFGRWLLDQAASSARPKRKNWPLKTRLRPCLMKY